MRQIFSLILTLFISSQSLAAVSIQSRKRSSSDCTYFSQIYVDTRLSYTNTSIPWGSKVELVSGIKKVSHWVYNSNSRELDWQLTETLETQATAPYRWEVERTTVYAVRGAEYIGKALQFVWKITFPDNSVSYDKGNYSNFGYYEVDFEKLSIDCQPLEKSQYFELEIKNIEKF